MKRIVERELGIKLARAKFHEELLLDQGYAIGSWMHSSAVIKNCSERRRTAFGPLIPLTFTIDDDDRRIMQSALSFYANIDRLMVSCEVQVDQKAVVILTKTRRAATFISTMWGIMIRRRISIMNLELEAVWLNYVNATAAYGSLMRRHRARNGRSVAVDSTQESQLLIKLYDTLKPMYIEGPTRISRTGTSNAACFMKKVFVFEKVVPRLLGDRGLIVCTIEHLSNTVIKFCERPINCPYREIRLKSLTAESITTAVEFIQAFIRLDITFTDLDAVLECTKNYPKRTVLTRKLPANVINYTATEVFAEMKSRVVSSLIDEPVRDKLRTIGLLSRP